MVCLAFSIQKCCTTSYHAQCNSQVERFHQTLFHMLGKLTKDKKAQWEKHLLEVLQACNSTRLAVTSYSLHYLMFGRHPRLPIDFYFPTGVPSSAPTMSPSMLMRLDAASKSPILKRTCKPTLRLTGKSKIMIGQQELCSLCQEMPFY